MSQRLENLKRQRQLIEEHLRWIDAEIVAETGVTWEDSEDRDDASGAASITSFPTPQPEAKPSEEFQVPTTAAREETEEEGSEIDALSDQLISQYGHITTRREIDPRLSLILFFGGLLGIISLVIFLVYWFGYR